MITNPQKTKKEPTPLEKLRADKHKLKRQSLLMEKELADDFRYVQENASSLFFSAVSLLLLPGHRSKRKEGDIPLSDEQAKSGVVPHLGAADLMSVAGGMLPIVWGIVQPMILAWGIRQTKNWLSKLFSKRK